MNEQDDMDAAATPISDLGPDLVVRPSVRALQRQAEEHRARALHHVSELCEQGRRDEVLRWLIPEMMRDPALKKIRLWQLDVIMFGVGQERAFRTIRKAKTLAGDKSNMKVGWANLGWALESRKDTIRMTSWLWTIMLREHLVDFRVPDGFPYEWIYQTPEGSR